MAVAAVLFWICLISSVFGSAPNGELVILHSPDSLGFTGSDMVSENSLTNIFSAALGLSVEENSEWKGLNIKDPFNTPEAMVEIHIDGISSLSETANLKSKRFPLKEDMFQPETFEELSHRIKQRNDDGNHKLLNINLSNKKELSSLFKIHEKDLVLESSQQTYLYLNPEVPEDGKFLKELDALKAVIEKVKAGFISADNVVDFYYFRFRSLHGLIDYHGPNSHSTKEAKKLLIEELGNLRNAFVKAYDGSVLVAVVTTDMAHARRAIRSVRNEKDTYPENYAPIFNILLWFGVIFVFTLIAIVYALVDMDPGRDSIIYRMTSTRIKKEN